jgi:N-acetylmuramoyl-L-alanine amidase
MVAGVAVVAALSVLVANSDTKPPPSHAVASVQTPDPTAAASPVVATANPTPKPAVAKKTSAPKAVQPVGAVTTTADTMLRTKPWLGSKSVGPVPRGILSPVTDQKWGFYKVLTPNENVGWLHKSRVKVHFKTTKTPRRVEDATIVIDPGHGGHQPGAKGPGGTLEKDVNLGISRHVASNLKGARIFMTRNHGHAGLAYRSGLANRLGAVAFVSVHNNALPDRVNSKTPGTEVYYRVDHLQSKRLAGLIYEEVFGALKRFKIEWGRDPFAGAKYRRSHEHGGDYYAVLRHSRVPAVIVENMFITNKREEKLLVRPDVRALIGKAIARGVKRFVETDAKGSGFKDPYAVPTPSCPIPGCFEHRK